MEKYNIAQGVVALVAIGVLFVVMLVNDGALAGDNDTLRTELATHKDICNTQFQQIAIHDTVQTILLEQIKQYLADMNPNRMEKAEEKVNGNNHKKVDTIYIHVPVPADTTR